MKRLIFLMALSWVPFLAAQSPEMLARHRAQIRLMKNEKSMLGRTLQGMGQHGSSALVRGASTNLSHILATQVPQYLTDKHSIMKNGDPTAISKTKLGKNIFSYAVTVAGIGAGTSILTAYSETGQIQPQRALDFLADSNFFKTSFGIFAGSTLLTVAGNFMPPGVGPILKTVPGFLGAALGYEWANGGLGEVDWMKIGISSLASSAAFVALGAGGALAIAGGIAASMLADTVYDAVFPKATPVGDHAGPLYKNFAEQAINRGLSDPDNPRPPPQSMEEEATLDHQILLNSQDPLERQRLKGLIQSGASEGNQMQTRELLNQLKQHR